MSPKNPKTNVQLKTFNLGLNLLVTSNKVPYLCSVTCSEMDTASFTNIKLL